MEHSDAYGVMLDGIFEVIERFAKVRIEFQTVARADASGYAFRLISVNGFDNPRYFYQRVFFLCSQLCLSVKESLKTLPQDEWIIFLEEVISRLEELKDYVKCVHSTYPAGEVKNERKYYIFDISCVDRGPDPDNPALIPVSVLLDASEFAKSWKKAIKDCRIKIVVERNYKDTLAEFPDPGDDRDARDHPYRVGAGTCGKMMVNRSVEQLGVYLRLLHLVGVFGETPKTEICRFFAGTLRTKKQERISWASLKNHLDNPSPEVLKYLRCEFHKMMQEITLCIIVLIQLLDAAGVFEMMDNLTGMLG